MLERKYGIGCFKPESIYRFRLFIPVYFNGQLVTFTTRSYNDKVTPKYLHCPKRTSSLFAKETLYNLDNAKDGTAIVVEGPIDAWRIGDGAVATFGVIYTQKQIKLLRERFKRVFIMYDADAQEQADATARAVREKADAEAKRKVEAKAKAEARKEAEAKAAEQAEVK